MKRDFDECFEFILKAEGGYVLHEVEGDPGGMTFAGISRKSWPKWEGWHLLEGGVAPHDNSLAEMVSEFYRVNFWEKIQADKIDSMSMQLELFDFAVNAGVKTAVRTLQKMLRVPEDGVIGPVTLRATNKGTAGFLAMRYAVERIRYYSRLVDKNPALGKFFRGWVNRVLNLLAW